jgi:hypothetical protein
MESACNENNFLAAHSSDLLTRSGKLHRSKGGAGMRPENPTLALFTVVGLMATAASAQVVRQEVPGIRNFAKVESTVACAGAITPAAIQEVKKMGYASIITWSS